MTAENTSYQMPDRSTVIEALSWYEDEQRGRWGVEYATKILEHLEAEARQDGLAMPDSGASA